MSSFQIQIYCSSLFIGIVTAAFFLIVLSLSWCALAWYPTSISVNEPWVFLLERLIHLFFWKLMASHYPCCFNLFNFTQNLCYCQAYFGYFIHSERKHGHIIVFMVNCLFYLKILGNSTKINQILSIFSTNISRKKTYLFKKKWAVSSSRV